MTRLCEACGAAFRAVPSRVLKGQSRFCSRQCANRNSRPLVSAKYRGNHRNGGTEHVRIAVQTLGRPLPRGAEVHHVDGDGTNNTRSNLVVCQDRAYHKLLHVRTRIVRAGGNPNTQKMCGTCKQPRDLSVMVAGGRGHECRPCAAARAAKVRAHRMHPHEVQV